MHVPAPIRVEFRCLDGVRTAIAYCHGSRVSSPMYAGAAFGREWTSSAWAAAFLQGVRMAPLVAGVRS